MRTGRQDIRRMLIRDLCGHISCCDCICNMARCKKNSFTDTVPVEKRNTFVKKHLNLFRNKDWDKIQQLLDNNQF